MILDTAPTTPTTPAAANAALAPPLASRRDTAQACRERAAADLLASVAMLTANQRQRLEGSAASWTVRADILERIEDSFARRTTVAKRAADGPETEAPARS